MELQYILYIKAALLKYFSGVKGKKDHLPRVLRQEGQESESEAEEQLAESTVNTSESISTDASTTTSIPSKQATTFL